MRAATFRPLPLIRGAHLQTLAGWFARPQEPLPGTRVHRVPVEDEDATTVHLHAPENLSGPSPTVVLIHGVEGNAERPYVLRTARKAHRLGFRTARMNMRWCGDAEGVSRRFYNSTFSGDVRSVCSWIHQEFPDSPIWVIGFSLGGNLALKMAAEGGAPGLAGIVAVSPPVDLSLSARATLAPGNKIYQRYLVKSLIERGQKYLETTYEGNDIRLRRNMTVVEFDEAFTVPLGGFRSLADYYELGSVSRVLHKIECPALIVTAQDDPLVPFESFVGVNGSVRMLAPLHGGHLGFVGFPERRDPDYRWAENRALDFIRHHL